MKEAKEYPPLKKLPNDLQQIVNDKADQMRDMNGAEARDDFHRRALKILEICEKHGTVHEVAESVEQSLQTVIDESASLQGSKPRRGKKGRVGITRITQGRKR